MSVDTSEQDRWTTLTCRAAGRSPELRRAAARCPRSRRRGRPTSRPAPCSTGSAPSTAFPSRPRRTRPGARWCTRCWSGSSTCRPASAPGPRPPPWSCRSGSGCGPSSRCSAELFGEADPGRVPRLHGRACSAATSRWRTRSRLEPAERECLVEAVVDDKLLIRGYIDRLDVSPAGDLRVVDYKTGGAPREAFEARALFQLKFYALVLWRTRGRRAAVAAPALPQGRRGVRLLPRRRGADPVRAHPGRAVAGDRAGDPGARLPAQAEPAVRLVHAPEPLPGLRRHPAAVPRAGPRRRRWRPRPWSWWTSRRIGRCRSGCCVADGQRVAAHRLPHRARGRA